MKTIKFSLPLQKPDKGGKYPIVYANSIEALRDNFDPHGLLFALKQNNLLVRWLDIRGYTEKKKKIEELLQKPELSDMDLMKAMAKIFKIDMPDAELDELLLDLDLLLQTKEVVQQQANLEDNLSQTLSLCNKRYLELIDNISQYPKNLELVKRNIHELKARFPELIELNRRDLFTLLISKAPLAILVMLADPDLRKYYCNTDFNGTPYEQSEKDDNKLSAVSMMPHKIDYYTASLKSKLLPDASQSNPLEWLIDKLGSYVSAAKLTGDWQTFEPEDCKVICLFVRILSSSGHDCLVNSAGIDTSNKNYYIMEAGDFDLKVLDGLQATTEDPDFQMVMYYLKLN